MVKSEWGTKRTCVSCGEPYYDLKKKNAACPKCGAPFSPKPPAKPKRLPQSTAKPAEPEADRKADQEADRKAMAPAKDKAALETGDGTGKDTSAPAVESGVLAGGDAIVDGGDSKDDEKNDALIVDTSDLSHDDDDVSEVKEHIDKGVEDNN